MFNTHIYWFSENQLPTNIQKKIFKKFGDVFRNMKVEEFRSFKNIFFNKVDQF